MNRRWCCHAYRVLVFRNRDYDLAGMQMQSRLAEARTIAINIVADNRPAHFGAVNAQLMGAAGDRFEREPGEIFCHLPPCEGGRTRSSPTLPRKGGGSNAAQHFPVRDRRLPFRIGLLPPATLGVEAAERHIDG